MCAVDSRGSEAVLLRPFGAQNVMSQMSAQCRTLSCSYCWGLVLLSRIVPMPCLLIFGVREYFFLLFFCKRVFKLLFYLTEAHSQETFDY